MAIFPFSGDITVECTLGKSPHGEKPMHWFSNCYYLLVSFGIYWLEMWLKLILIRLTLWHLLFSMTFLWSSIGMYTDLSWLYLLCAYLFDLDCLVITWRNLMEWWLLMLIQSTLWRLTMTFMWTLLCVQSSLFVVIFNFWFYLLNHNLVFLS